MENSVYESNKLKFDDQNVKADDKKGGFTSEKCY